MNYFLDTTFVIDAQKAHRRGKTLETVCFEDDPNPVLWISAVAWGEFLAGKNEQNSEFFDDIRTTLEFTEISEATSAKYAEIYRDLQSRGQMIGPNDIWIAATALEAGYPLLTRNSKEFSRVKGLTVISY